MPARPVLVIAKSSRPRSQGSTRGQRSAASKAGPRPESGLGRRPTRPVVWILWICGCRGTGTPPDLGASGRCDDGAAVRHFAGALKWMTTPRRRHAHPPSPHSASGQVDVMRLTPIRLRPGRPHATHPDPPPAKPTSCALTPIRRLRPGRRSGSPSIHSLAARIRHPAHTYPVAAGDRAWALAPNPPACRPEIQLTWPVTVQWG
jgi:hypothetical protein